MGTIARLACCAAFAVTCAMMPPATFAEEPENLEKDAQYAENEPPVIPHPAADNASGEQCLTCHGTGIKGAPLSPHPIRVNCTQCHVRSDLSEGKAAAGKMKNKRKK